MSNAYSKSGVNYNKIDPIKKLAQQAALSTSKYLKDEITATRGESAYVWKQGKEYMASVVEGLGTKNLVADEMRKSTAKTYYDAIGYDTVSSIINDLVSVGAKPLTIHAYWAVGSSNWFDDTKRASDLVKGWKKACDDSEMSWGGGETPSLSGIINPDTIDLGGSAVGVIKNKKQLLLDKNLRAGDRIILLQSNGINMNGLSLARSLATKLPKGYGTKLPSGKFYGEALLKRSHIYAKLIQSLFAAGVEIHYISNITGHGLRKVMRGKPAFTYVIEKLFKPQEEFLFIQKHDKLSDREMYETFNMGQDYALFVPPRSVEKTLKIIQKSGFKGVAAGYIERGVKKVVLKEKNIMFESKSLDLR